MIVIESMLKKWAKEFSKESIVVKYEDNDGV